MPIITQEKIENEYREAVRNKYNIEKNGSYSHYLDNPTQANLRDICWEIFRKNEKLDDLSVYHKFFRYDFNKNEEDISIQYTDKFRKVRDFYLGKKKTARTNTIDLAAILVDFEPRPFRKFEEKFVPQNNNNINDENIEGLNESIKNPYIPQPFFSKELIQKDDSIEVKDDNAVNEENLLEDEISNQEEKFGQHEVFNGEKNPNENENSRLDNVSDGNSKEVEEVKEEEVEKVEEVENENPLPPKKKKRFREIRSRIIINLRKRIKKTAIATAIIFIVIATGSLATVIYINFFQKECMQWSGDHFEEVSCNLEIQGIGTYNSPEPYDERIINLKKIKVCDTTAFFRNEKAVVWYTKVGDSAEFFNTHGMHPENGKALRPVTQYIIDKYVKKH